MISQENHKLLVPFYEGFYGVGCNIDDRSNTDDDRTRKIDLIINGIRIQEKTCNAPYFGFLTALCGVLDFTDAHIDHLVIGYINAERTRPDAVIICDWQLYREFLVKHRDSPIEASGMPKPPGCHKWIKTKPVMTPNGVKNSDFIAPPLTYLLDSKAGRRAILQCTLSSAASEVLDMQRECYNLRVPECIDMLQETASG
ncbi:MAG: hypothetical protein WC919_01375 [Candidatus Paceibacterota bacterium]